MRILKKALILLMTGGVMMTSACAATDADSSKKVTEPEEASSMDTTTTAAEEEAVTTTAPEVTTEPFTYTTEPFRPVEEYGKVIAITFDDGPNTSTTNEVLDVLEEYGVVASFFVIGTNINEDTVPVMQRAVTMGCEINSHSMTHSYMNSMKDDEILAEIESVNELIVGAVGREPAFFRAPYLATSGKMFQLIETPFIAGYGCNDWDPAVDVETRVQQTLEQCSDGAIILLHDAEGNSQTVEALRQIIPQLLDEGYELVTVSELFHAKEFPIIAGLKQQFSTVARD